MKIEDAVLVGGIGAAAILALWSLMKEKQEIPGGPSGGEITTESTITVEPIE